MKLTNAVQELDNFWIKKRNNPKTKEILSSFKLMFMVTSL